MTLIRFAISNPAGLTNVEEINTPLHVLMSYAYKETFPKSFDLLYKNGLMASWMLDSGAYSVWKSGKVIRLEDYVEYCRHLQPKPSEIVSLDAVNDPATSVKNAAKMKELGFEVMPVFHVGEPMEILEEYCANYKKVGLSCRFGEPLGESLRWLCECFKLAYPHKFHSFGWTSRSMLTKFPFYSADTSSWNTRSFWGKWHAFKNASSSMSLSKGHLYSCIPELKVFLELQRFLQARWGRELEEL